MEMAATSWNRGKKRKALSEMVQPRTLRNTWMKQAELLLLTLTSMQQQDETPLGC
jgi:hypothetical protein